MKRSRLAVLMVCMGAVAIPACVSGERSWSKVSESEFTAQQERQVSYAAEARTALFERLMAALTEVVESDGPAAAIDVCKDLAPDLAQRVSEEYGVAIGRTSFKLRNPASTAPEWAEPYILAREEEPAFATYRDGTLGTLLPIHLQERCIVCHGPEASIPGDVRAQLDALYAGDEATGFHEGDLRGWFWVEVPLWRVTDDDA
jgi:hypothetical protein